MITVRVVTPHVSRGIPNSPTTAGGGIEENTASLSTLLWASIIIHSPVGNRGVG